MAYHISGASLRRYVLFWLCAFLAFAIFLLAFRTILLPFVAGRRWPIFSTRLPTGWSAAA